MRIPLPRVARAARSALSAAVAAAVAAAVLAPPAAADTPSLLIEDGATQVAFDYADAVYQEVDIRTEADSDGDGEPDTVRLRLMRPRETESGLKVATILEPSPYWAGIKDVPMHEVDLDDDGAGTVPRGGPAQAGALAGTEDDPLLAQAAGPAPEGTMSGYYDNYFLPRGYAVAQLDSVGSGDSTGCPTTGGENETLGVKAAVDWLNGRTVGWDPDGEEVTAGDWSTGNVAMTGISYNGTLPVAAATTGVEGLRTIVPQGAISSWYEYYRDNGGVIAPGGYQGEDADVLAEAVYTRADQEVCGPVVDGLAEDQDRGSGDYTRFWSDRNYRDSADDITASVFIAHGLNDWNVKTDQGTRLWEALEERDVPRRLWLHQGGHTNPFNLRMDEWLRQMHSWFDYWLYDLDNGVMEEPAVHVENADFTWSRQDTWPAQGTGTVRLRPGPPNGESPPEAVGVLAADAGDSGGGRASFTDAGRTVPAEELATDPELAGRNALVHRTAVLPADVRVNGTVRVSVRAAMDGPSPYLSALLVDYGTDTRATGAVEYDRDNEICYGEGVPEDTGCAFPSHHVTETADFKIVTRGWIDARNRRSESWQTPVVADRMYRYSWELQAQDYVFKAGHRIGIVLISTDHDYTQRYPEGTEITVDTGRTTVDLPVSLGRSALS
ncbi:Xaa-Pro dipeptidyl-peptidase [Nocardiopsis sediminis]|uniref:Xaa-Pro dipeptidyl-peptidase n=1 Tax=Nocardiopsis sediminis TaxID=1778267 RepID=A0ABV8FRV7_9ACTN